MAKLTKARVTPDKSLKTSKTHTTMSAPDKMQLLFTIVNRSKTEFYVDLIQSFEVNMQLILHGKGTADIGALGLFGLGDTEKSVIISVIRREKAKEALSKLEEKFSSVKNGKGIAYTVPMTSTIGVAIYQFLSNKSTTGGLG